MAINFNQQEKKKKYSPLFVVMIAVLVLGMAFLVWVLIKPGEQASPAASVVVSSKWKKFEINFDVLESPIFVGLNSFEKIPPFEGAVGRENPFKP